MTEKITANPGSVFPPRDEGDIAAYNVEDVVEGYRSHAIADAAPGDNRAPGYRWGWMNARKDASHQYDGFEPQRYASLRMTRMANGIAPQIRAALEALMEPAPQSFDYIKEPR